MLIFLFFFVAVHQNPSYVAYVYDGLKVLKICVSDTYMCLRPALGSASLDSRRAAPRPPGKTHFYCCDVFFLRFVASASLDYIAAQRHDLLGKCTFMCFVFSVRESAKRNCVGRPDAGTILQDKKEHVDRSTSVELFPQTFPNLSENLPKVSQHKSQHVPNKCDKNTPT